MADGTDDIFNGGSPGLSVIESWRPSVANNTKVYSKKPAPAVSNSPQNSKGDEGNNDQDSDTQDESTKFNVSLIDGDINKDEDIMDSAKMDDAIQSSEPRNKDSQQITQTSQRGKKKGLTQSLLSQPIDLDFTNSELIDADNTMESQKRKMEDKKSEPSQDKTANGKSKHASQEEPKKDKLSSQEAVDDNVVDLANKDDEEVEEPKKETAKSKAQDKKPPTKGKKNAKASEDELEEKDESDEKEAKKKDEEAEEKVEEKAKSSKKGKTTAKKSAPKKQTKKDKAEEEEKDESDDKDSKKKEEEKLPAKRGRGKKDETKEKEKVDTKKKETPKSPAKRSTRGKAKKKMKNQERKKMNQKS